MSDPKNKWSQPPAPPAPMFFGKKERDLVKQVNDELSERIIGQPIAYYPISLEESNFNETYGEAVEKISLPPVRVFAYVVVDNEQTNERYGYEYQTKLTVNFHRRRLVEDQDLYVRVGDFVQYGDEFYEIVRLYNDTRYLFGQVEHKFQVTAECVRARRGVFKVMPSIDRPVTEEEAEGSPDAPAPRPAPYPPLTATYITVTPDSKLPNERVLTAGEGITLTDAGSNSTITIAASGQNAVGPTGSLQLQQGAGSFTGSSNLTFLADSGPVGRLGIGTDAPTHELTVEGAISASSDVLIGGDLTVRGTLIGASPLKILNSIAVYDGSGAILASIGSSSFGNNSLSASFGGFNNLSASANVSASYFYGDGSQLNNLPGGGLITAINGTQAYLTSSLSIGGTSAPDHRLSISGSLSASVSVSASAFYGDGSNLSGITTEPAGATTQIQYNNAGDFGGSANLTYHSSTEALRISGAGPKLQFDETDAGAGKFQIATSNGMLKWQVQNEDFDDASVKWMMNSDGQMAFRDGAAGEPIPARMYISGSGNSNLLQVSSSAAANILVVTGSGRVGVGTASPSHELTVIGSISASSNISASAYYGDGSNLSGITTDPAGATTQIQYNNAGVLAGSANFTIVGSTLSASALSVGPVGEGTVLRVDGSGEGITAYEPLSGTIVSATTLSASLMNLAPTSGTLAGPGSYLGLDSNNNLVLSAGDGATTSPGGATTQIQFNNAGAFGGSANLTFNGVTLTGSYTGSLAEFTTLTASTISASTFYGDGSNLSNLPDGGLLTAIDGSSVYLTSSLAIGGTSAPDHAVAISGSLSASVNISASTYYGDGAELTSLTIGAAEDASYADGLFTDFATTTPVGTAVDRFNEILKALSPGPAPNLDDVDCNDTGVSAELSFGSSQAIGGYTNVGTTAGFSAVDINGTYGTSTSSNNLRRGTFNGSRVIDGDLNEDVSADGVNYPANSFGDANLGNLVLEVNGSTLHTASMTDPDVGAGVPGSGTGTDYNGNGSGFNSLSQTGSAEFADSTELDLFQHRTGKYKVVAADQREGWNYLRVVHTSSTFDRATNYVAWVNDSNSNALAASDEVLDTLSMTGDLRLSGVKYHTGGTAEYRVAVSNAYRNVYTSTNISYTVTNGSISSVSMPSISVGSEDETKVLHLTGSLTVDGTSILDSSIGAGVNVSHPLKSNLSNGGSESIGSILAYNRSNNSSTTSETFRRENYRLDSGSLSSYGVQADVTDAGNAWNSTSSLASIDGLLFYNQRLYSPIDGDIPNNGDFSAISNGPAANVDYSSITGTRTFFRYFTNTGAASQTNFELAFTGDTSTRIAPSTTALSSTNIHVFVKLPTTSTGKTTGWLDLGSATASDPAQLNNFDGAYVGTPPAGGLEINNDTHEATLVTQTVEQNENIVIKIVADATWTGYISALSISWGGA